MEVFSIFATLSLKDLISGPLGAIRDAMRSTEGAVGSLGQRMGNLAVAMGPLALASGALLGGIGKCVSVAAGFEDQMAKVGAISRANAEDMKALEAAARDLGATTQFTASEVAQGEQYLAMAGFSAKENIEALPGVLNLAAATATDLGRAADVSSDILGAFGLKTKDMTRVVDTLALTCAQANTDLNLLADTMKYCAPVARDAGLSIEETAAMAGLLGDVGIKGSQAGTTLKAMLNKMAAPTSEATKLLKNLGIVTKDTAGNLRSPIKIMEDLSAKLKGMGSADQIKTLKTIVGEEAEAGFSALLKEVDGAGKLHDKILNLVNGKGTAAQMAERMNNTLAGSVRSLGSAWESLQITIGKIFIPIVRKVVDAFTSVVRVFDRIAASRPGKFILQLAASLASAVVAVTAFAAGFWAIGKVMPFITGMFTTIKAALLGLGGPVWIIIGAVALLYATWKNNFGGIATVMARWGRNISLVFDGVNAVFATLKGTTGEIKGELAKNIKAAGLVGLVTTVARVVYRIREFFAGLWDGIDFNKVINAFMPAVKKLRALLDTVGNAFARLFGHEIKTGAKEARSFGEIVGSILTKGLEACAVAISLVATGLDNVISFIRLVYNLLTGDFAGAAEMAQRIWTNFGNALLEFADLIGLGESIRKFVNSVKEYFANFNIIDGIKAAWDEVVQFFAGLNLFESGAKLIETLKEGILSAASSLIESVTSVFSSVRNLLPFSDAKEGPLSELTLSGSRIMTTLGEGVDQGKDALVSSVHEAFGNVASEISGFNESLSMPGINAGLDLPKDLDTAPLELTYSSAPKIPELGFPDIKDPELPPLVIPPPPGSFEESEKSSQTQTAPRQSHNYTITIQNVSVDGVQNPQDFVSALAHQLQGQIAQLEGA